MGQKHPFSQQRGRPLPGSRPEESVKTLYSDEVFFNLRNSFPEAATDHLAVCLTPSLLAHFERSREAIAAWKHAHRNEIMRPPLGEGPIFLSTYEGADSSHVGTARVSGRRAEVPVQLTNRGERQAYRWTDIAIVMKHGDRWLLDDIRWDPQNSGGGGLRDRTTLGN